MFAYCNNQMYFDVLKRSRLRIVPLKLTLVDICQVLSFLVQPKVSTLCRREAPFVLGTTCSKFFFIIFPFFLSLSQTYTHTHTHTNSLFISLSQSLSLYLSLYFFVTRCLLFFPFSDLMFLFHFDNHNFKVLSFFLSFFLLFLFFLFILLSFLSPSLSLSFCLFRLFFSFLFLGSVFICPFCSFACLSLTQRKAFNSFS